LPKNPSIGSGDVEIELYNITTEEVEKKVLKPTFLAAQTLSRKHNGGIGLVQRLSNLDLDAISSVIELGLNLTAHGAKTLPERIYQTGTMKLSGPCIRYVHILQNGGKAPEDNDEDEGGEETPLE
jgi:hypothetical protein